MLNAICLIVNSRRVTLLFPVISALLLQSMATEYIYAVAQSEQTRAAASSEAKRSEVTRLEAGKPVERDLAGSQEHTYEVELAKGEYLKAIVEQKGIDVVVVVIGPDGKQMFEVNNLVGKQGSEDVEQVAEASGSYSLKVRAQQ